MIFSIFCPSKSTFASSTHS